MDKMREEFERWNDAPGRFGPAHKYRSGHDYSLPHIQRAWAAWQHLYPMVADIIEAFNGMNNESDNAELFDAISTAKARLEGKDE